MNFKIIAAKNSFIEHMDSVNEYLEKGAVISRIKTAVSSFDKHYVFIGGGFRIPGAHNTSLEGIIPFVAVVKANNKKLVSLFRPSTPKYFINYDSVNKLEVIGTTQLRITVGEKNIKSNFNSVTGQLIDNQPFFKFWGKWVSQIIKS
jgi:hypothetical protein